MIVESLSPEVQFFDSLRQICQCKVIDKNITLAMMTLKLKKARRLGG